MFVNGAPNFKRVGLGVVILDHEGDYFEYFVRMDFQVTNHIVEYEASIFGVVTLKNLGANNIIFHSPRSVLNQYIGTFETKDSKMRRYVE